MTELLSKASHLCAAARFHHHYIIQIAFEAGMSRWSCYDFGGCRSLWNIEAKALAEEAEAPRRLKILDAIAAPPLPERERALSLSTP